MSPLELATRFSDACVVAIKAEMGRRGLSSRALGRLIGKSSQYMSDRLDGGSSKTGERVTLTVRDLSAMAHALGMNEVELVQRAEDEARATSYALAASDDVDWQHEQEEVNE